MKSEITLFNACMTRLSISDICHGIGFDNPVIDREIDEYVRLRASDSCGNICYMKITK